MSGWLRLFAVALVALAGCFVELDDRPGRACDDANPCREPRRCVAGACFADTELDAGAGGGGAGGAAGGSSGGVAGGGAAGGTTGGGVAGGAVDAGPQPIWQQRVHGFSDVTEDTGCDATIDPSRGNLVVASVMSSRDAEDTASANVLPPLRLPTRAEGRVRGRLTLGAVPRLVGNAPFVELGAQPSGVHLQLAIAPTNELVVSSQAMTVADSAVSARYAIDGGWQRGDYLFEVRWRRGATRAVWLNGQLLGQVNLPSTSTPAPPDRLRLGIMRLDGPTDGGPFSVTLNSWQLAEDADAVLGDVP
ncbi:MAG: hypothetical protein JNJ54_08230 [Myxococcaceae bacterium]|nr:hypothetical protein [Myxococcaceae bacterium]